MSNVLEDQTILLSEVIIKLAALEQILKAKNLLTEEELISERKIVIDKLSSFLKNNTLPTTVEDPTKN